METLIMKKITDQTEFEFYYSRQLFALHGGMKVNGVIYTERVMKGTEPIHFHSDTKLVASGRNIDMKIERI